MLGRKPINSSPLSSGWKKFVITTLTVTASKTVSAAKKGAIRVAATASKATIAIKRGARNIAASASKAAIAVKRGLAVRAATVSNALTRVFAVTTKVVTSTVASPVISQFRAIVLIVSSSRAGNVVKQAIKTIVAGPYTVGQQSAKRQTQKALTIAENTTVTTPNRFIFGRVISVTQSRLGSIAKQITKLPLAVSTYLPNGYSLGHYFEGAILKTVNATRSVTDNTTTTIKKQWQILLSVTSTAVASLYSAGKHVLVLTVTAGNVLLFTKLPAIVRSATQSRTATVVKQAQKTFAKTLNNTVAVIKKYSTSWSVSSVGSATLNAVHSLIFAVTTTVSGLASVGKWVIAFKSITENTSKAIVKMYQTTWIVSQSVVSSLVRSWGGLVAIVTNLLYNKYDYLSNHLTGNVTVVCEANGVPYTPWANIPGNLCWLLTSKAIGPVTYKTHGMNTLQTLGVSPYPIESNQDGYTTIASLTASTSAIFVTLPATVMKQLVDNGDFRVGSGLDSYQQWAYNPAPASLIYNTIVLSNTGHTSLTWIKNITKRYQFILNNATSIFKTKVSYLTIALTETSAAAISKTAQLVKAVSTIDTATLLYAFAFFRTLVATTAPAAAFRLSAFSRLVATVASNAVLAYRAAYFRTLTASTVRAAAAVKDVAITILNATSTQTAQLVKQAKVIIASATTSLLATRQQFPQKVLEYRQYSWQTIQSAINITVQIATQAIAAITNTILAIRRTTQSATESIGRSFIKVIKAASTVLYRTSPKQVFAGRTAQASGIAYHNKLISRVINAFQYEYRVFLGRLKALELKVTATQQATFERALQLVRIAITLPAISITKNITSTIDTAYAVTQGWVAKTFERLAYVASDNTTVFSKQVYAVRFAVNVTNAVVAKTTSTVIKTAAVITSWIRKLFGKILGVTEATTPVLSTHLAPSLSSIHPFFSASSMIECGKLNQITDLANFIDAGQEVERSLITYRVPDIVMYEYNVPDVKALEYTIPNQIPIEFVYDPYC